MCVPAVKQAATGTEEEMTDYDKLAVQRPCRVHWGSFKGNENSLYMLKLSKPDRNVI